MAGGLSPILARPGGFRLLADATCRISSDQPARAPGADLVAPDPIAHDLSPLDGFQNVFWTTSCSMTLSSDRSATSRFSLAFLLAQLLQLMRLVGRHAAVDLPAVERLLGDARLAAHQELAGHRSLGTTLRYMHLSPAAIESAIWLLEPTNSAQIRGDIVETVSP